MEKSALIDNDVNYDWNFLNYPIHTVSAKPKQTSKECAILLIHGFGASTDHWRFNIPVLSTKYEVHAMDLLGFGKSPKPQDIEYSGSLWKDQVVAYVKEKIKKPTIVVGNSLGGHIALVFAKKYPKKVKLIKVKLEKNGEFDLKKIMSILYQNNIRFLLVEGGNQFTNKMLDKNLFNEFYLIKTDNKLRQSGKLNIKKIVYKLSKKFKIKSNINQYFDKNRITRFI